MQKLWDALQDTQREEKEVASKILYSGKILQCELWDVHLPKGKTVKREIIAHKGAVAVVPIDHKDNVTLVLQFRPAMGKTMLEIPSGLWEKEETALQGAQRELKEETGLVSQSWQKICTFIPTPGYSTEEIALFIAWDCEIKGTQSLDEDENITSIQLPLSCLKEILEGKDPKAEQILSRMDGKTITGLLYAASYLNKDCRK